MARIQTRRRFLRTTAATVTTAFLLSTGSGYAGAQTDESWTQSGHDAANTRFSATNTGPTGNIDTRWENTDVRPAPSAPAVVGDSVYVGARGNTVYALNIDTGEKKWSVQGVDEPATAMRSPAVVDGTVYVSGGRGNVYALASDSGTQEWKFEIDSRFETEPSPTPAAVTEESLYFGTSDGRVFAVEIGSGNQRWQFEKDLNKSMSTPAVGDDLVYIGSDDENLYALDRDSGSIQWQTSYGWRAAPTVAEGKVYTSNSTGGYALDSDTGEVQWSNDFGVPAWSAISEDAVYMQLRTNTVLKLDPESGEELWRFEAEDDSFPNNPAISVVDETVYLGDKNSKLYAIDSSIGEEKWRFNAQNQAGYGLVHSPAVVNGNVFIGSWNGVFALTDDESTQTSRRSDDPTGGSEFTGSESTPPTDTSDTTTEPNIQDTGSFDRQQGTANNSQESSDPFSGLAAFTQFGNSGQSIGLGGLITALGLGGGYTAYRRFTGNDDNSNEN